MVDQVLEVALRVSDADHVFIVKKLEPVFGIHRHYDPQVIILVRILTI